MKSKFPEAKDINRHLNKNFHISPTGEMYINLSEQRIVITQKESEQICKRFDQLMIENIMGDSEAGLTVLEKMLLGMIKDGW